MLFMATSVAGAQKPTIPLPPEASEVHRIRVDSIRVGTRMRPVGDIESLVASIRDVGLMQPITVMLDRTLISGLHRLEAFKVIGRKHIPAVILDVSEQEAQLREIDENLVRNNLSVLERADHLYRRKQLYEELYPGTRQGGNRGNQHTGGRQRQNGNLPFWQIAGSVTRQSASTVQRLVRIAKDLAPEAKDSLRGTEWADNRRILAGVTSLAPELQIAVAAKLAAGEASGIRDAMAKVQGERLRARRCKLPDCGKEHRLLFGDFRKVGSEVASGTVDLLITDAPFESRDLDVFAPLSTFAARVLKPGGSLLCMVGLYHLPQILNDLGRDLRYHWTIPCVFGDGAGRIIHSRRVFNAYRVFLWFVKGTYGGRGIKDVINGSGRDKRVHPHGQSEYEFASLIEKFTEPGDMVLDPFVGGGTTAVAALNLGRCFIGIDIQREHIEMTRRRVDAALREGARGVGQVPITEIL
jgi:SAM-dependent methyltransferase